MPCYEGVVTDVQVFEHRGEAKNQQEFEEYLAELVDVTGEFESRSTETEVREVPCRSLG